MNGAGDHPRYAYGPKPGMMALIACFFAGCAAVLFHAAGDNQRGMTLNRIFQFDAGGATKVLLLLAIVSLAFVAVALFGLLRSFGPKQEIDVDDRAITAPKHALGGRVVTVPFETVTDVHVQRVQSQEFLIVRHGSGKLTINRASMENRAEFNQLVDQVMLRAGTCAQV